MLRVIPSTVVILLPSLTDNSDLRAVLWNIKPPPLTGRYDVLTQEAQTIKSRYGCLLVE
jgi:hypothetical protein